ncbi:prepilin-type N-terminal cleavage/methylation domain-containing protein [Bradyrhizobium sp. Arg237L]|uniref:prepilin-type N-terminal cleavage/methylation domain-containing protein n=1 Tax=Bradyrhizobium sp. Arg237L TaxID=3003352 RepID=UPI00249D8E6F|nr:prepilin-type N-terminal cleavage/methylation domain-containing protein [Bradyrhizobium sp. Arg237L]MDI4235735.1 prepilin-type N-terminal cleavage/methylation domain-containing protein [Bradyrhizobium sp. Arg237L]
MSTGTTVAWRSICRDHAAARGGFTLIEALVAMALLLAFVSVLGPHLFYARRIADKLDGRIAAQTLLRAILDAPVDRMALAKGPRDGETAGLRWTVTAEPMFVDGMVPQEGSLMQTVVDKSKEKPNEPPAKRRSWIAYRVSAKVSCGPGQVVSAETLRLGPRDEE